MSELGERIVDRLLASTEPRAELIAVVERLLEEHAIHVVRANSAATRTCEHARIGDHVATMLVLCHACAEAANIPTMLKRADRAALLEAELGVAIAARAEVMSGRGLFVRDDFGHPSSAAIHELVEAVCVALRNHGRR